MKKRKTSTQDLKPNKITFQSNLSIYKTIFFYPAEITFKPKFSITKNMDFLGQKKIGNNLAKAFKKIQPLKF